MTPCISQIKFLLPTSNHFASTLDPVLCRVPKASSPHFLHSSPSLLKQYCQYKSSSIISHLKKQKTLGSLPPPHIPLSLQHFSAPLHKLPKRFFHTSHLYSLCLQFTLHPSLICLHYLTETTLVKVNNLHVAKCNQHCSLLIFWSVPVFNLANFPLETFSSFVPRVSHSPGFPLIHLCQISPHVSPLLLD